MLYSVIKSRALCSAYAVQVVFYTFPFSPVIVTVCHFFVMSIAVVWNSSVV